MFLEVAVVEKVVHDIVLVLFLFLPMTLQAVSAAAPTAATVATI